MFGHVNDGGFWLFKEYFNLSIKDTLKSWCVMETSIGILGLIGVMIFKSVLYEASDFTIFLAYLFLLIGHRKELPLLPIFWKAGKLKIKAGQYVRIKTG